ncbi:MAG TPA: oligosaccharide flippase family protein [Parapedobacter sp.]|nr:oligosaccharide flippase family protein [Parapedobacter sp.]
MNYNKIYDLFKNKYLLSLLSNGSNAFIGMVTLTVLFRHLTLDAMGEYGFFLTVLLFFDTFRSGFISTAFINYYAGYSGAKKDQTAGAAWIIAGCITLISLLVSGLAHFVVDFVEDSSVRLFLNYFGVIYTLSLPFFMANCVLQAQQQFGKLLIINLCNQGALLAFILIVIFAGHIDVNTVIYCYMAANLFSSMIALLCGWTLISKMRSATRNAINELFNFGKYSVGTNMTATLMSVFGTVVIKFLLGAPALAVYNAGSKLVQIVELPLRSLVYAALPAMSERYNTGDKRGVVSMMERYIGVFTLALIPVCLLTIVFSDWAILLLAGEKYVDTAAPNILRIYMLITLLFPAERIIAMTIDVFKLPKINFMKVLVMVTVGSLAGFIGIYVSESIYAATLPSAVSVVIGLIIALAAINRHGYPVSFLAMMRQGAVDIMRQVRQ